MANNANAKTMIKQSDLDADPRLAEAGIKVGDMVDLADWVTRTDAEPDLPKEEKTAG